MTRRVRGWAARARSALIGAAILHDRSRARPSGPERRFRQPAGQPQRAGSRRAGRSQGRWRQGSPPAPTPSFAPGRPSSSNSRWSEFPVPSSRTQLHGHTRARGRRAAARPPPAAAARRAGERSQNGPVAADLVQREGEAQPLRPPRARARRASASAPRWSGEPVYTRSSAPVAASQTSQPGLDAGAGARRARPARRARRRCRSLRARRRPSRCAPSRSAGRCAACPARRSRCASARGPAPRSAGRATRSPRGARRRAPCSGGRGPRRRSAAGPRAPARRCRAATEWASTRARRAPAASGEQPFELLGLGHRRLAGEVLADVGGGPAVDRVAVLAAAARRRARRRPAPRGA